MGFGNEPSSPGEPKTGWGAGNVTRPPKDEPAAPLKIVVLPNCSPKPEEKQPPEK